MGYGCRNSILPLVSFCALGGEGGVMCSS
jgi:hypothetical protein